MDLSKLPNQTEYAWVGYFAQFADKLLNFKNDRTKLIELLIEAYDQVGQHYTLTDNGRILKDICPFTVFGCFNKRITDLKRTTLLKAISEKIGLYDKVPEVFNGVPVIMAMATWFFGSEQNRKPDDIDNLWDIFEQALAYSDNPTDKIKSNFIRLYDKVVTQRQIKFKLSLGLFWIRAMDYISLESTNRSFLKNSGIEGLKQLYDKYDLKNIPDGTNYLNLVDDCKKLFINADFQYQSFPEMSHYAWLHKTSQKEDLIPNPPPEHRYWLYTPGEGSTYWDEYYFQGMMAIGWDDVGDLSKLHTKDAIATILQQVYVDSGYKNVALALWQFSHEMKPGDIVYVKRGTTQIIGKGIIESDYFHDSSKTDFSHIRKVKWTNKGEWDYPGGKTPVKTLTDITSHLEIISNLESEISGDTDPPLPPRPGLYTDEDFLEEVFLDENQLDQLKSLILKKKNLILQGPPGVGKTFIAERLAYVMMKNKDPERIKFVQFHQSYSYEDFICGFRPQKNGLFELAYGPFYDFCKKAGDDPERMYFFIIDEINRGNISKIFGELLMLIEKDKRDKWVQLMYSDELFSVPSNVYIIGMMNTADRSIAFIDYALRRRFAFFNLEPAFDSDGFALVMDTADNKAFDNLVQVIKDLNREIEKDASLGRGFQIGHSYLCVNEKVDKNTLLAVVNHELMPLLDEYWFDDRVKVKEWSERMLNAIED